MARKTSNDKFSKQEVEKTKDSAEASKQEDIAESYNYSKLGDEPVNTVPIYSEVSEKSDNQISDIKINKGVINKQESNVGEEIEKIHGKLMQNNDSSLDRVREEVNKKNTTENKQELAQSITEFKMGLQDSTSLGKADKHNINKKLNRIESEVGINKEKGKSM